MVKNKKIRIAIIFVLVITAIAYIFVIYYFINNRNKYIEYIDSNCPGLESHSGFADQTIFIDCKGNVFIERYTEDEYPTVFVSSSVFELPISFMVKKYKFSGNYLYYIEDLELELPTYLYSDEDGLYSTSLPVNDEYKSIIFKSKNDIPVYRKIDVKTGNFVLYKNLNEVSLEEQKIFTDLVNSTN